MLLFAIQLWPFFKYNTHNMGPGAAIYLVSYSLPINNKGIVYMIMNWTAVGFCLCFQCQCSQLFLLCCLMIWRHGIAYHVLKELFYFCFHFYTDRITKIIHLLPQSSPLYECLYSVTLKLLHVFPVRQYKKTYMWWKSLQPKIFPCHYYLSLSDFSWKTNSSETINTKANVLIFDEHTSFLLLDNENSAIFVLSCLLWLLGNTALSFIELWLLSTSIWKMFTL
jgi:hypothetical protein